MAGGTDCLQAVLFACLEESNLCYRIIVLFGLVEKHWLQAASATHQEGCGDMAGNVSPGSAEGLPRLGRPFSRGFASLIPGPFQGPVLSVSERPGIMQEAAGGTDCLQSVLFAGLTNWSV